MSLMSTLYKSDPRLGDRVILALFLVPFLCMVCGVVAAVIGNPHLYHRRAPVVCAPSYTPNS